MKNNLLQGRAFYAALFVLLLSVVGMKNVLAQNQVAMLQHNDTITGVFYGADAFVSAYNAAANGDVITLSSGTFNKSNIGKAITIRGVGCAYDSVTQVIPTIIPGDFYLYNNNICFESVCFSGMIRPVLNYYGTQVSNNNVNFLKCNINTIGGFYSGGVRMNWQFVNCIIKDLQNSDGYPLNGMSLINTVVRFSGYGQTDIHNPTTINNSIVLFDSGNNIKNIVAYNSIFVTASDHEVSNCNFFNSIGIKTGETSLFEGQTTQNVMEVNSCEDIFETFTGEVTFDNIYQLKQNVASSFLGNDGTEVGIYGGVMPYRTRPNYMIIKNCNVAGRTTEDNKLSVEIELFNAGE